MKHPDNISKKKNSKRIAYFSHLWVTGVDHLGQQDNDQQGQHHHHNLEEQQRQKQVSFTHQDLFFPIVACQIEQGIRKI